MKTEIWIAIPGFEGHYSVSNFAKVKSEARFLPGKQKSKTMKEKFLKPSNHTGYLRIYLRKDEKTTPIFLHKLVFESFNGPVKGGNQVDHIDGNKHNNNLDNLREATPSQNRIYALEKKYNTVMIPGYVESDPGRAIFMSKAFEAGRQVGYARALEDLDSRLVWETKARSFVRWLYNHGSLTSWSHDDNKVADVYDRLDHQYKDEQIEMLIDEK